MPGIGYSICDERGYLPDVLEPLIEDRDTIKAEIRETEDEECRPDQSVSYVVVDDTKRSRERVMLASEELNEYDVGFYRELLVRAAVSVLSPLGWRESDIEEELGQYIGSSLVSFG